MRAKLLVGACALGTILLGCAGGGSGVASGTTTTGGGEGPLVSSGSFQLRGDIHPPVTASGSFVDVVALTGNITSATLKDTSPTPEEGEIVFASSTTIGWTIEAISPLGEDRRTIAAHYTPIMSIQVHPAGTWVYFLDTNGGLYRVAAAGGTPILLKTIVSSFTLTPSGAKLVYKNESTQALVLCSPDGSGAQTINTLSGTTSIVGSALDTEIYILNSATIYSLPLTPNAGQSLVIGFQSNRIITAAYSSAKRALYVKSRDGSTSLASYYIVYPQVGSSNFERLFEESTLNYDDLSISPDGSKALAVVSDQVDHLRIFNDRLTLQSFLISAGDINSPKWTPSVVSRTFVGSGGFFTTGAAALLFSENQTAVPSVVLADCTTRSSMVVTKESVLNATNVLFRLTCDNLTKLYYTKSNGFAFVPVVTGASGLKGALVKFSSSTGRVTSILTFSKKPVVNRANGRVTVEGAEEVIDPATGARRPARGSESL